MMHSKTKPPLIAITGSSGFLGSALVQHFNSKGWSVLELSRKPPQKSKKNILYAKYDLDSTIDPKILSGVDYIIHTAYMKQDREHSDAFNINVVAAKNLLAASRKMGIKKCLFISSMSAHEQAISVYGRQKLKVEKIFSGSDCISIRSGLIIGNGGIVKQMIGFMRSKHMVPLVDGGKQPIQIIYIDDLVLSIDKLIKSKVSGVLTLATPEVYTYKKLYQAISKQLDIKVLYIPIPFFVLINLIRLINILPIPAAINPDNALGLKALRSTDTKADLKKANVELRDLKDSLSLIDI